MQETQHHNTIEEKICHPDNPCPCRMQNRIVLRDGERVEFADYQCVGNDAPFDGWQCVQLKSQRELCHDYIRRPLKKPIVVNVKYGCEPRPNLGYRKDHFEGNQRSRKHHHHPHHHHHRQQWQHRQQDGRTISVSSSE